jgi:hypothetical protein
MPSVGVREVLTSNYCHAMNNDEICRANSRGGLIHKTVKSGRASVPTIIVLNRHDRKNRLAMHVDSRNN